MTRISTIVYKTLRLGAGSVYPHKKYFVQLQSLCKAGEMGLNAKVLCYLCTWRLAPPVWRVWRRRGYDRQEDSRHCQPGKQNLRQNSFFQQLKEI